MLSGKDLEELLEELEEGDKVLLRTWEDMEKEYGIDDDGNIEYPQSFPKELKYLAGTVVTVKDVIREYDFVHFRVEEEEGTYDYNDGFPFNAWGHIERRVVRHKDFDECSSELVKKCTGDPRNKESFDYEKEIFNLKEELEQLKKHNNFLRKTVAFFATEI